jgi:dUTP pyrophosphatase
MSSPPTLHVRRLPHARDLPLPSYATEGAAGLDLCAALECDVTLESLERLAVPTGLEVALPAGYEGQVRARSGRALREGLALVNAPGTIDADYRGEMKVLVVNLGREPLVLRRGDRIAQLVVAPVARASVVEVLALEDTSRAAGGFGSTGR